MSAYIIAFGALAIATTSWLWLAVVIPYIKEGFNNPGPGAMGPMVEYWFAHFGVALLILVSIAISVIGFDRGFVGVICGLGIAVNVANTWLLARHCFP